MLTGNLKSATMEENVDLLMNIQSLPFEDRIEHVYLICSLNGMSLIDFNVILEAFGYSSKEFFDE